MVGRELELEELLTLLNRQNVLSFEGLGIKVTLNPSGPPQIGELQPKEWSLEDED